MKTTIAFLFTMLLQRCFAFAQQRTKQLYKISAGIFMCMFFLQMQLAAQRNNYYVSVSGNDSNNGHSIHAAWRSLNKINSIDFKPGDSVLFEGGATFSGTIQLTAADNGSAENPVVFTSYGNGKATIDAGNEEGLLSVNTSFFKLSALKFQGSGVNNNKGNGIHFYADDSLNAPADITITTCEVKGFKAHGIAIGADNRPSWKGYRNVRITYCDASENGESGFASYGSYMGYQHEDFYMAYCKAFGNRGIQAKTEGHSGNGIVMGMVDGLLIEHCEAYENGADNRCYAGGPVGIWVWMCKNATIQYCISHDNHTGSTKDGGGFDIDGGASHCILQYNYSYNNDGAGYLLAEYGALFPFTNNIIRFNVSASDGRKNNYGALSLWGADSACKVTNSYVYNNTFYVDDDKVVSGTPAAVTFMGPHVSGVIIANNIFVTKGKTNFINSDSVIKKKDALLLHNNYYSYSNRYMFSYAAGTFSSLEAWRAANKDQEIRNNKTMYAKLDPGFTGTTFKSNGAATFILQQKSLLRKNTFLLPDHFLLTYKAKDMGGNALPADKKIFPGAYIK